MKPPLLRRLIPLVTLAVLLAGLLGVASPLSARVRIKLGTSAPKNSSWHDALSYLRQEWRKISGGDVMVTIYAGGVLGDDSELVRKIRRGGVDAIGVSGIGLSRIDKGVECLNIPMMVRSYDELDYVRKHITAKLEQRIETKGFVVLNWADVGWVHFFTKKPARSLDDIREQKLWISSGDAATEKLYKQMKFQVVALDITDMLTSLQTGIIEAFQAPPLFAMLEGSYRRAGYMTAVRWAPLMGATLISKRSWDRIPSEHHAAMRKAAQAAGDKLRDEIRRLDTDAITQMKKRGLKVIEADAAMLADWQKQAEDAYPNVRGTMVPPDLFDEVRRLRDEYRAKHAGD